MTKRRSKVRKTNVEHPTGPHFNTSSETPSSDISRTNQSLDSTRSEENLSDSLEAVTLQDCGNSVSLNNNSSVEEDSSSKSDIQKNQKQGSDYCSMRSRHQNLKYKLKYPCVNDLESIPEPIVGNSEVLELQKEESSTQMLNVNANTFVPRLQVVPNRIQSTAHEHFHKKRNEKFGHQNTKWKNKNHNQTVSNDKYRDDNSFRNNGCDKRKNIRARDSDESIHKGLDFPSTKHNKLSIDVDIPKNVGKPNVNTASNEVSSAGSTNSRWDVKNDSNTYLESDEQKRGNYNENYDPEKPPINEDKRKTFPYSEENNIREKDCGASNWHSDKSSEENYSRRSSNPTLVHSKTHNYDTGKSHIDKEELNVMSYAGAANSSRYPKGGRNNHSNKGNWHVNKSYNKNYYSSDWQQSSNQSLNNSFSQKSKRYSDPRVDRDRQSTNNIDEEYQTFKQYENIEFMKLIEKEQDLFAMPKDYALAHCVAEDMRMGSGIAVQFKRDFESVDELLQQKAKQGGLATLKLDTENGIRYIYYLVTKTLSNGKPTYYSFWSSLREMRNHIRDNDVKKLAMPRIGCGLDQLEWSRVKPMIEYLFKDLDVEIVICNFQQSEGNPKKYCNTHRIVHKEMSVADIEPYTIIIYLSTEDGHISDDMRQLNNKFNFKDQFRTATKRLGDCIKFEQPTYSLYGCIVRKTAKSEFDYLNFRKCLDEINEDNIKYQFSYVAIQAIKDENDPLINEKLITVMRDCLRNFEIYFCWNSDLSAQMPLRREDKKASLENQSPRQDKRASLENPTLRTYDKRASLENRSLGKEDKRASLESPSLRVLNKQRSSNETVDLSKTLNNYDTEKPHNDIEVHNVMSYANAPDSSSNITTDDPIWNNTCCYVGNDQKGGDGCVYNWHVTKNYTHSSGRRKSSNQGMNNSSSQQSKRYSGPYFDADEELQQFQRRYKNKFEGSFKVIEKDQDLFAMPKDYAFAHCVAEDMRMGSGIAVQFKRDFKSVDELLQQKAKQGGLATLELDTDNGIRYIYYLVTKRLSNEKPTYGSFWSSLRKMRDHIRDNDVKKLAMPRIGCGLDRLEWSTVKPMIEFLFEGLDVEIVICNFQQSEESPKKGYHTCKIVHNKMSVADIDVYTIIIYFSTEDGYFSDDMNQLAEKFNFKNKFQTASKQLGDCIKFEQGAYYLYGCIVRKTAKSEFDYKNFKKCLDEINWDNKNYQFSYVAIQAIEDDNDPTINEKLITIMTFYLRNVEVHFCWNGDLSDQMPVRRDDKRASLENPSLRREDNRASLENQSLRREDNRRSLENQSLKREDNRKSLENQWLKREDNRRSLENQSLKREDNRRSLENQSLKRGDNRRSLQNPLQRRQ